MRVLVAVVLAVLMVGCSSDHVINNHIRQGTFSFNPSNASDYDYDVKIERVFDIDFDTSKPEDRIRVIKKMMGDLCPNPVVKNEHYIDRGKALIGPVKLGTYLLQVSCPK